MEQTCFFFRLPFSGVEGVVVCSSRAVTMVRLKTQGNGTFKCRTQVPQSATSEPKLVGANGFGVILVYSVRRAFLVQMKTRRAKNPSLRFDKNHECL
eukprot:2392085-Amphidinium_carterae.1